MLSAETIKVIKSTVPLLQEHGLSITTHFYQRLFRLHPELNHVFNKANQREGTQARALADAVFAYANNIENLEELLPAVQRIAHKHASIGVTPEQYDVVGQNLLAAIQHVLALPDDHVALDAWGKAYSILADVFITAEAGIYHHSETQKGGWRGFRKFTIDKIEQETDEVKSFYLTPTDGRAILSFQGGQYVGVKVNPENSDYDEIRQYSLSGATGAGYYRISTKVEPNGCVSSFMHNLQEGSEISLRPPTGVFTLTQTNRPQVFLAGGIGITPLYAMLQEAVAKSDERSFTLIQCARSAEHVVFAAEIRMFCEQNGITYKLVLDEGTSADHEGLLSQTVLDAWDIKGNIDTYCCGPKAFMSAIDKQLQQLGVPSENRHAETFGPTT